jgi:hypothetical protein
MLAMFLSALGANIETTQSDSFIFEVHLYMVISSLPFLG